MEIETSILDTSIDVYYQQGEYNIDRIVEWILQCCEFQNYWIQQSATLANSHLEIINFKLMNISTYYTSVLFTSLSDKDKETLSLIYYYLLANVVHLYNTAHSRLKDFQRQFKNLVEQTFIYNENENSNDNSNDNEDEDNDSLDNDQDAREIQLVSLEASIEETTQLLSTILGGFTILVDINQKLPATQKTKINLDSSIFDVPPSIVYNRILSFQRYLKDKLMAFHKFKYDTSQVLANYYIKFNLKYPSKESGVSLMIPKLVQIEDELDDYDNGENDCNICFDILLKDVLYLKCGHRYHKDCVYTWAKSNGINSERHNCPECRQSMAVDKIVTDNADNLVKIGPHETTSTSASPPSTETSISKEEANQPKSTKILNDDPIKTETSTLISSKDDNFFKKRQTSCNATLKKSATVDNNISPPSAKLSPLAEILKHHPLNKYKNRKETGQQTQKQKHHKHNLKTNESDKPNCAFM